MRKTSLTEDQARELGRLLNENRERMGLSMRQLASETGVSISTICVLEAGTNLSPLPETLKDIAKVLNLRMVDLFLIAEWLPADELPTLRPYLRAKYQDLNEVSIATLERFADKLIELHGVSGPQNHEDERP
ncbi:Transcriptional regulator, contains XRE-family HTH domain [Frankineae bacterium MT45]|nr:Transcriptional regulator, contains XRE-family HTH domain [Frankineae bacterium MT45]